MSDDTDIEPAPPGWVAQGFRHTFAGRAGPFYFRTEGPPGVGFFSRPHHANLADAIHGGALMTLADMAIFAVCRPALGGSHAVTVTLNSEFLNPGPIGAFIYGEGEVTKAGRSLILARGLVRTEETPLLAFSGVLKRISRPTPTDSP